MHCALRREVGILPCDLPSPCDRQHSWLLHSGKMEIGGCRQLGLVPITRSVRPRWAYCKARALGAEGVRRPFGRCCPRRSPSSAPIDHHLKSFGVLPVTLLSLIKTKRI